MDSSSRLLIQLKSFLPDAKPFGLSYEEHAKNYWKWVLYLPINIGPFQDKTEKSVLMVKSIPIHQYFILVGVEEAPHERESKVPAGKGILIPVLLEFSDKEVP